MVALLPEEKIVRVDNLVKGLRVYFTEKKERKWKLEHTGDLILTNERLIFLEPIYKLGLKWSIYLVIAWTVSLLLVLVGLVMLQSISTFLTGMILILVGFLAAMVLTKSIIRRRAPVSYRKIIFEVHLEHIKTAWREDAWGMFIVWIKTQSLAGGEWNIPLAFQRMDDANEFLRELNLYVHEAKRRAKEEALRPKEIVHYHVVAEFTFKDGVLLVRCPHCGASVSITSKESEQVCPYCGSTFIVPKKILDMIK